MKRKRNGSVPWYTSKTLWAAAVMAAVEIIRANGWIAVPPSVDMLLLGAIVYGRVTAQGPISNPIIKKEGA